MRQRTLALILPLALILACGDEPDPEPADGAETKSVSLDFEPIVGDEAFSCESTFTVGTSQTELAFTEFKMFVSNVRFIDPSGVETTLELSADTPFQDGTVALLDFEDGTGSCGNGTPETNFQVTGTIPERFEITGVSFDVGVPFESNHQDQATAADPLSLASMFWNWQGGYKFIRLDGATVADSASLRIHLGSTGCELADGSTTEVVSCANPNRISVVRDNVDLDTDVFTVDAAELLQDVDLTPDEDGVAANCQARPSDPDCAAIFPKFGLPWMGDASGAQTFIQVRP